MPDLMSPPCCDHQNRKQEQSIDIRALEMVQFFITAGFTASFWMVFLAWHPAKARNPIC